MNKIRTIKLYKSYFKEFYIALPKGVRDKINYSLYMVETMKIIPSKFFKNIVGSNGLYEIRSEYCGNIYRILCCMDNDSIVVLLQGFQKKSRKHLLKKFNWQNDLEKNISKRKRVCNMETGKKERFLRCSTFEELLNEEYGCKGTPDREAFDSKAQAFCLAEQLKEERRKVGLTQEQLAKRIVTKKSYISRIENGHTEIQLSTLFRIFAGLGRQITFNVLRYELV